MPTRTLFLTLKVFSATGGIEKVSRVAGKALAEICTERGSTLDVFSIYDKTGEADERYIPATGFTGFGGSKTAFIKAAVKRGSGADLVILSHINLLPVGYAIKKLSPKTRLVLIAHGIEVWEPLSAFKRMALRACDLILPVSRFTREKALALHGLDEKKVMVLNNCLDPFLAQPTATGKQQDLLQRYGLTAEHTVLLTLARLSSAEQYKGYDEVIMAVKTLKESDPSIRYLLVGKSDKEEKARLQRLISQQGVNDHVIFAGFVPDSELADHFNLADVYVMPSRGEGFGIVFIEALYYGLPVIAGNSDGSSDALSGGKFGSLVNPSDTKGIVDSLKKILYESHRDRMDSFAEVKSVFGFMRYKNNLKNILDLRLNVFL